MKVLFAASEAAPFAKTGGLADVAGSLPRALAALGHDVRLVMPRYRAADVERYGLRHVATFYVPLSVWKERCSVFQGTLGPKVTAYFIHKDIYFDRPELYRTAQADYPDNAERFSFFSRAVLELCSALRFAPDIIHCNDWQTGLVPLYLKTFYHGAPLGTAKTVFTIHNLGYQGIFRRDDLRLTGLPPELFTPEGVEFWGNVNFLKAGLISADAITTVSETYSREILTPEYGHGLDGVLRKRSADLSGIVNGIDTGDWNPARDPALPRTYSAGRLGGKAACKIALLRRTGLPDTEEPVVGMVTRLTAQKGLDILLDAIPRILQSGCRLIILGSGDEQYHRLLSDSARAHPDRMRLHLSYDDALARLIYAGSDMFLMPSRYEPCGLGQLIALRYGAVPVVRAVGGLADTVMEYRPRAGTGTGFRFTDYGAKALVAALQRALAAYRNRAAWLQIVRRGMGQDFSWKRSAKEYERLYAGLAGGGKGRRPRPR